MGWYLRIDQYLINKIQDAFLWLFDWTGIFVAPIALCMFVLTIIIRGKINPFDYIALALIGYALLDYYRDQASENFTVYNLRARFMQSIWIRHLFVLLTYVAMVITIINVDIKGFIGEILFISYMYLLVVQIRKREPKEFKQLQPAMETGYGR